MKSCQVFLNHILYNTNNLFLMVSFVNIRYLYLCTLKPVFFTYLGQHYYHGPFGLLHGKCLYIVSFALYSSLLRNKSMSIKHCIILLCTFSPSYFSIEIVLISNSFFSIYSICLSLSLFNSYPLICYYFLLFPTTFNLSLKNLYRASKLFLQPFKHDAKIF